MAESIIYNPTIYCGATWRRTLYVKQPNREPADLTGCSVVMELATDRGATTADLTLTSTPAAGITITEADGKIAIVITDEQTALLTAEYYEFDIFLHWPDGSTDKITEGTITTSQEAVP